MSLFALLVGVFFLVRLTGDPLDLLLPEHATPEDFDRVRAQLGLDRSVFEQFRIYLSNLVQGDLGESYRLGMPVTELIGQRLPATMLLGTASVVLTIAVSIPLGIYAAYRRGGILDRGVRAFAAFGQSAPNFWIGLLLILVFAVGAGWLPVGGYGFGSNLVLPALTVSFAGIAGMTRILRSSVIDELSRDYVEFLRLKGISERVILWKHVLRNAGLTTLTYLGVVIAAVVAGSVVVETVFTWPGVGRLMVEAVEARDFPVVQGVILMISAGYIVINLVVDALYAVLNPRLRAR